MFDTLRARRGRLMGVEYGDASIVVVRFGTRVAHIASFPPLGVAFMYLYRTVQASPQPCQPDSKRPQV